MAKCVRSCRVRPSCADPLAAVFHSQVTVLHPARIDDVLQTLYDKALFTLALQLAKSRGIGREGIADVHRRYADWLYEKGDWEGSVGQYVKTIGGGVQGSYVIRRVRSRAS